MLPRPINYRFNEFLMMVRPERQRVNRKAYAGALVAVRRQASRACGGPLKAFERFLVIAQVSKTVMPVRVPTGQVFSHRLAVFATDSYR